MEGMSKREFKQEVAEMSMRDEMLFPPWYKLNPLIQTAIWLTVLAGQNFENSAFLHGS